MKTADVSYLERAYDGYLKLSRNAFARIDSSATLCYSVVIINEQEIIPVCA